jgi:hypothetical protein
MIKSCPHNISYGAENFLARLEYLLQHHSRREEEEE